jgi:hypothetical protein
VGQGGQTQAITYRILTGTSTVDQNIWVLRPALPLPESQGGGCQVRGGVLRIRLWSSRMDLNLKAEAFCATVQDFLPG